MQHVLLTRWSLPARLALTVGLVLLATLIGLALDPLVAGVPSWGPFYIAVLLAALTTGLGGGLLTLVSSTAVGLYVFIAPYWQFGMSTTDEISLTAVFAVTGLVLTVVGALLRSTAGRLASARETAQRRAERLRIAAQAAHMGTWDVELPSGRLTESDEIGRMFGGVPGPAHADLAAFAADLHPHDRERVLALFDAAVAGTATFHIEFRTRLIDGAERYIESAATVLRDATGTPYRVIGCSFDVTERRAVEAERADLLAFADAARSEAVATAERVSGIIESVTDGFYALDDEWRFVYLNECAERFFGRPRVELLGAVIWERVPTAVGGDMWAALHEAARDRRPVERAFLAPLTGRWIEVHAFPAAQQLNVFFRDVTDRHLAAEALRESEQRFRALADESPVLMWTVDVHDRCEFINETYRAFLGLPYGEALARWRDALHPDDAAAYWRAYQEARERGALFRGATRFQRHDGEWRWLESVGVPRLGEGGRVLGYAGTSYDVTERRQAETELRASRERLREALRHVEYVTDRMAAAVTRCSRDLHILWASRRYTSWLGQPHEEVVGRPLVEVLGEEALAALLPYIARVLQGARVEFERELPLRGPGRRWVHSVYEPTHDAAGVPDGWIAVVTDITERKALELSVQRAEEAARARSAELETILDILPVGVAIAHDPRADRITVNSSFERLLDLPPGANASLTGRSDLPFHCRRDGRVLPADELPMQVAARTGAEVLDQPVDFVLADGREINMSVSAAPLFDGAGMVRGAIGAHVDVTEHRRAAAELREADRRKDEFLAMLAHELRNPLAPIRNAVEVLRALAPRDVQLAWARDMIDRQVRHMTRLVDDLLEVSRITRGKITLRRAEVALGAVVADAIETARPLIAQHGHHLAVDLAPEPLVVDGDRARLVQVLANLLSNAAKFTPPGGDISITTGREDGTAVVRVRDTGIGIPPELQDRIFEIFTQEESTLARSQGGLGIGLTLAQRLVELHGGNLSVASPGRGRGAEFTVSLPLLRAGAQPVERAPAAAPPPAEPAAARPLRVLVVEDNVDAADSFRLLLELGGHEVRVAHLGREALRLLDGFVPDVAFIDLGLPEMSGFEVAERLRDDPRARGTMLVALSGYGRDEDKAEGRRAGFHHHLTKPVDLDAINTLLASVGPGVPPRVDDAAATRSAAP